MINKYEVTLKVQRNSKETLEKRVEHAYGVHDAILQACVNHVAEHPLDKMIGTQRVGPPEADILFAEQAMESQMGSVLARSIVRASNTDERK